MDCVEMRRILNYSSDKLLEAEEAHQHDGESDDVPVKITSSTYLFAICASVNSCNLGYDIGISTEIGRLIQDDFGLTRTSSVLSIQFSLLSVLYSHTFH